MDMYELCCDTPPESVKNDPRYVQDVMAGFPELGIEPKRAPLWHLDGVAWHDAPKPRRWHRHWPQTVGLLNIFREVHRCACGAHGGPGDPWIRG